MKTRHHKKARKPRTIINGSVDIDNVFIDRGVGNVNWLKIAKQKLKQRESTLMQQRQRTIFSAVTSSIGQFTTHFNRQRSVDIETDRLYMLYRQEVGLKVSDIISRFDESLMVILCKWEGYSTAKEITSFRKYFEGARRWFDTKKIAVITLQFLIPFMQLIREFAIQAAAQFPACGHDVEFEALYRDYLTALVFTGLCEGEIKPSNTHTVWLIPAMAYSILSSKYNQYLQISIDRRLVESRKNKMVRDKYLECLRSKKETLSKAFEAKLLRFYDTRAPAVPAFDSNVIDPFPTHPSVSANHPFNESDLTSLNLQFCPRNEPPMEFQSQMPIFSECGDIGTPCACSSCCYCDCHTRWPANNN